MPYAFPSLEQILAAREARWQCRCALAKTWGLPVLSCTLRMPHALRLSATMRDMGRALFEAVVERVAPGVIRHELFGHSADGPEGFVVTDMQALHLKKLGVTFETGYPLGALVDVDVLDQHGLCVEREGLGLPPRPCVVCGAPAWLCIAQRAHPVKTVTERVLALVASVKEAA